MTARRTKSGTKPGTKRQKYNAQPTTVRGVRFASKAEARRWLELSMAEHAGAIRDLRRQVRFPLCVNGEQIGVYVADFVYVRPHANAGLDLEVVEDVKGVQTQMFRWKARHFAVQYMRDIEVWPVKATKKRKRAK